jgi:anti-anti-sigma factor
VSVTPQSGRATGGSDAGGSLRPRPSPPREALTTRTMTGDDPLLQIQSSSDGAGHVTVRPVGDVDAATSPLLHQALVDASNESLTLLEVDMSSVEFLDSSGISALIAGNILAADHGARLIVTNPQPPVRRVLDLTGLSELLAP